MKRLLAKGGFILIFCSFAFILSSLNIAIWNSLYGGFQFVTFFTISFSIAGSAIAMFIAAPLSSPNILTEELLVSIWIGTILGWRASRWCFQLIFTHWFYYQPDLIKVISCRGDLIQFLVFTTFSPFMPVRLVSQFTATVTSFGAVYCIMTAIWSFSPLGGILFFGVSMISIISTMWRKMVINK